MHFSKVADPISFPSPGIFREGHEYGSVLEYSSWSTREGHRVQQPSSILEAQACQTVKAVIASGSDKSIGFACGTDAGVQRVCHYSSTLVWGSGQKYLLVEREAMRTVHALDSIRVFDCPSNL